MTFIGLLQTRAQGGGVRNGVRRFIVKVAKNDSRKW
jgi:hypothetical protein